MVSSKALLDQHVEKFLSELPIKNHIKEWKILHHSSLFPIKGQGHLDKYDLVLYTHYNTADDIRMNVSIGIKTK